MAYHIQSTFGVTAPVGACLTEVRRSSRVGRASVREAATGNVVKSRLKKVIEQDITLSGKGDPGFAAVVAGSFTEGTPKIISAEGSEVNDGEYSDMEITAKAYTNRV